jgi:UDP-N-acetylglucosamine acyltransferase
MTDIHKTAIVSSRAELGDNVTVGPYAIIEDGVVVGDDCQIGSSVLLATGAVLGRNVRVFHSAVVGTVPQDLKFGGEKTKAIVGDNTTLREFVTVNRGTVAHGESSVGKNCLLMAYAHVAHDCILGDNVIMANSVNLGGHVEIDDYAIVGGVVPVHQFVKIGAHAMIGGGFRVAQDVCPFSMAAGYPLRVTGINSIGLRRRGFARDVMRSIENCFKLLFYSNLNTTQAVERIKAEVEIIPEVQTILDFIKRSTRGLTK